MFRNAILRRPTSVIVLMILGLHCGSAGVADAQTLRAGDIATVLFPLVTFGIACNGVGNSDRHQNRGQHQTSEDVMPKPFDLVPTNHLQSGKPSGPSDLR
jgi:hypothetical protein